MYKLLKNVSGEILEYAKNLEDGSLVHRELNQAYLAWLAEGNQPLPADEEQT